MRRCGRCLPRRAGRRRCRSPPSSIRIRPSRPRPTPTRKRLACSTWPGRPPSERAPTWCSPMTRTPTGWPFWCQVRAAGGRSPGTSWARCSATRCWPAWRPNGRARGPGRGRRPPVVATTVVSGSLLRRLAEAAGVRCVTTLTGFKWIARAGGDDGTLVYGYEQALGYAVRPDLVAGQGRDQCGAARPATRRRQASEGRTLADRLDDLALAHGLHVTRERALRADGAAGLARLADAVERVRKDPPRLLAGQPVTVTDLREDTRGRSGPGRRPRRAVPRPADPARRRADLARRRRRPGDDPAERHRTRCSRSMPRSPGPCVRGKNSPMRGRSPPGTRQAAGGRTTVLESNMGT